MLDRVSGTLPTGSAGHWKFTPSTRKGPGELTIDVDLSVAGDNERVLVLSSGVHGVEGFFGHTVQLAAMQR
jgi:hypothetical protein